MTTQAEIETQEKTIKLITEQTQRQDKLNQSTTTHYERLSYFEREEIAQWLKKNLNDIPMLAKTKKSGLEEIQQGGYESKPALLLIRQALQALRL
jgi:hypothetical protein